MPLKEYNPYISLQQFENNLYQKEFKPVDAHQNIGITPIKNLSESFMLGNESALAIDINLSKMPRLFGITIQSWKRAVCDAIWLYSLENINNETILHGTFVHGFTTDRPATEKFIQQQIKRHSPQRRGAMVYHDKDLTPILEQELTNFVGGKFDSVQETLPRPMEKDLYINITKADDKNAFQSIFIGNDLVPFKEEDFPLA